MKNAHMLRALLAAATLLVAAQPSAALAQVGAQGDAGQGAYQVGDRLAAPAPAAQATFREITWDDLIPTDWKPEAFLADLKLDELQDADPRASEAMQRMRDEWNRAPVVERLADDAARQPGAVRGALEQRRREPPALERQAGEHPVRGDRLPMRLRHREQAAQQGVGAALTGWLG